MNNTKLVTITPRSNYPDNRVKNPDLVRSMLLDSDMKVSVQDWLMLMKKDVEVKQLNKLHHYIIMDDVEYVILDIDPPKKQ